MFRIVIGYFWTLISLFIILQFELVINVIKFQYYTPLQRINVKKDAHFRNERRIITFFGILVAIQLIEVLFMMFGVMVNQDIQHQHRLRLNRLVICMVVNAVLIGWSILIMIRMTIWGKYCANFVYKERCQVRIILGFMIIATIIALLLDLIVLQQFMNDNFTETRVGQ